MIRALQVIGLSGLVKARLPANVHAFLKKLVEYASLDIFEGETFYANHFKFTETTALNDNFDMFGIGDKNFVNNTGPYFIMIIILIGQ